MAERKKNNLKNSKLARENVINKRNNGEIFYTVSAKHSRKWRSKSYENLFASSDSTKFQRVQVWQ